MKKLRIYKLVQTAVLFAAAIGLCTASLIYGSKPEAQLFFQIFFWILLFLSFICILVDLKFFSVIDTGSYNLRRTAYVDPLTGVMNHTGMDLLLSRLKEQGQLPGLACAAFQLSNLFEVNDTQGHDAGDRLVRRFGTMLSAAFSQAGYVCRNNADIFFAVIPGCAEDALHKLCEEFRLSAEDNNAFAGNPHVEYRFGCAVNSAEKCSNASDLLSIAYKRIDAG